jgi:hypothetical protein
MGTHTLSRELKRGSTELLILALLEEEDRHGYDIARLIDVRSRGDDLVPHGLALPDAVPLGTPRAD